MEGRKVPRNAFSATMLHVNLMRTTVLSAPEVPVTPWIAWRRYDGGGVFPPGVVPMGNTDYFQELVIHTALCNPDYFIFWSAFRWSRDQKAEDMCMTADCELVDRLLDELNGLVGYADRRTLVSELAPWHQGYLLSGMYANGRNVWRLTPDLTEPKALATFVVRQDPPTFAFAGKQIAFPQGKLLQPEDAKSANGWWITTPAGVKPTIDPGSAPQ